MSFKPKQCENCPDYNEPYMKANGEIYYVCDECPVPKEWHDEEEEE